MITMNDCVQAGTYEYKGLSTDTKPTDCAVNSFFLELDTGTFFYFDGAGWIPLKRGGGGGYNLFKSLIDRSVTEVTEEMTKNCATIAAYAFKDCKNLTKVKLHSDVIKVAWSAFRDCTSLSEVTFPESGRFNEIGTRAFEYCTSLREINIPSGTRIIGPCAFGHCTSATRLSLPNSITNIAEYTFEYCEQLNKITIPSSVKSIEGWAFQYCGASTNVRTELYIPGNSVTYIGTYAFYNCSHLENIDIPTGVLTLDKYAFQNCIRAETLSLPHTLTKLGEYCFAGCASLNTKVTIPSSLSGNMAWEGSSFERCTSLVTVHIEDDVSRIGDWTFSGCTSLQNINFPGSLGTADYPGNIGASAFRNCTSLKSIGIGEGIRHIGDSAFEGCANLSYVSLPSTISNNSDKKGIGSRAFYYGKNIIGGLTTIEIRAPLPPTIGENVFKVWQGTSSTTTVTFYPKIKVPHNSVETYQDATAWYPYKDQIQSM